MKIRNILSVLVFSAVLLASCGTSSENGPTEKTTDTAAAPETETAELSDDLPESNFDGRDYRILTCDYLVNDYDIQEETGSLMSDAVYHRNRAVEERFNVNLVTKDGGDHAAAIKLAKDSILADDDSFDIVIEHMIDIASSAVTGTFADVNMIDYIDFQKPWWNTSAYENLSINDHVWLMAGDISPYFLQYNYVMYFNKRLAADYDISDDDLYTEALDGKWTIAHLQQLTKDIWQDLNGNGQSDESDLFGMTQQVTSYATPYIYAFGETTVSKDKYGIPQLDMNADKFTSIVETIYSLIYEQQGTLPSDNWTLHKETFMGGRAVFMNGPLVSAAGSFASMEDDFGILPMPKWDEAQENYQTMSDGSAPLAAIPKTVKDTDFVGIVTEGLAHESYKTVTPVLYESSIKVRGARDETSVKVIDIAIRTATVDFGYVYGNYNMMGFTLSDLMGSKNPNFASYFAENKDAWEAHIADIVNSALGE